MTAPINAALHRTGEARLRSALALMTALAAASPAAAQTLSVQDVLGPAAILQLKSPQPPARLLVDAPLPGPLAEGKVFIQYRAENLRIQPVFGAAALAVTPRIGHIHVTVDQAPWHWADASGEPIILVGLPPGPHSVEITLADATHRPIDSKSVSFVVPATATHQH